MKRYRSKYQTGGTTDININSQREFFKNYINSPNYLARLKKQGHTNTSQIIKDRLKNASTMRAAEYPMDTQYFQESNFIPINSDQLKSVGLPLNSTIAHEFSHGVGALEPDYAKNKNLGLNQNEVNEFLKRNKLSKVDPTGLPYDQRFEILHDKKASESKADLDTLRYMLKKDKIFDTGTQKFDINYLKKAKSTYKSNPTIGRLISNFGDDDLIYLMNNIAQNNQEIPSNNAQMGGLQSILGYAYGSPFSSSPYLDISTPEGLITMENTPIDLLGIDNMGNAKVMKAGRKNPYKFKGNKVREIPLQQGGVPPLYTRDSARYQAYLDSLYLYNKSKGAVDSLRNAPTTITKPRPFTDAEIAEMEEFDSAEARLDRYTQGKLRAVDRAFKGNQLVYEYAKPKQRVILGDPPVPRYVPQERNLPNTDITGTDMTVMNPIQPAGRPTDVTPRATNYSVTVRDENSPSKQRVIYFNTRDEWRNFLDSGAVSPISTQEKADSGSAATYRTMKKGGLTAAKAKEMLRDGKANGKKLTKKQRGYFGWVAGGKKQMGGNPYSQEELFNFIFDDEEETGNVKGAKPTAPTVEEVDVQVAMNDLDAQRRLLASEQNDALAMEQIMGANQSQRMNPYSGEIMSSGQYGAQNVGDFGRQIYGRLASDLGYLPVANSIYRSPQQQEALIASGAPAAKNSWHLSGNAIDLKPADWHRLTDEQQQFYRNNYDVVTHNNHYHIEPK